MSATATVDFRNPISGTRTSEHVTAWRSLKGSTMGEKIRARYGFEYLQGNRRPHFHIVADIVRPYKYGPRWENKHVINGKTYLDCGGGCCHEDIAAAFPELSHLIRWHLVDDDAQPMHYVANAIYWWEMVKGVSQWTPPANVDLLKAYDSTVSRGPNEPRPWADTKEELERILLNRADRILVEMKADMDKAGVVYLQEVPS